MALEFRDKSRVATVQINRANNSPMTRSRNDSASLSTLPRSSQRGKHSGVERTYSATAPASQLLYRATQYSSA